MCNERRKKTVNSSVSYLVKSTLGRKMPFFGVFFCVDWAVLSSQAPFTRLPKLDNEAEFSSRRQESLKPWEGSTVKWDIFVLVTCTHAYIIHTSKHIPQINNKLTQTGTNTFNLFQRHPTFIRNAIHWCSSREKLQTCWLRTCLDMNTSIIRTRGCPRQISVGGQSF